MAKLNRISVALIASGAVISGAPLSAAAPAANVMQGQTLYEARCGGCHSIETDRIGPHHRGVVGRKAGKVAGFDYSPALKKAKFVWTPAKLDKWLQGPSKVVPGTMMFFTVPNPADRAAIIAYLATQK